MEDPELWLLRLTGGPGSWQATLDPFEPLLSAGRSLEDCNVQQICNMVSKTRQYAPSSGCPRRSGLSVGTPRAARGGSLCGKAPEPSQGKPGPQAQALAADPFLLQTSGACSTLRSGCCSILCEEAPLPHHPAHFLRVQPSASAACLLTA